jgi:GDP-4-dehydro-6-deoxy-D-mannose reductase
MKVLITGSTGQTASYLCEYILANHPDVEIHCTRRWRSREEHIGSFAKSVIWHDCEMKDQFNVHGIMNKIRPDKVFVYSASSFVRDSWAQPWQYMDENVSHLLNVMNSVLMINNIDIEDLTVKLDYNPKIFVALSSEEYGKVPWGTQITEEQPLLPVSPYGVSKCAADLLSYQYFKSYGMNIYRIRLFNNEGIKRGSIFVSGNFCKQVALIEKGEVEPILYTGNLDSVRDWISAKDACRAAYIGLDKCIPGEVYNVCSETKHTIKEFVERLQELSTVKFEVKQQITRMRPSDVDYLYGSCKKFREVTGFIPEYDFLKDVVPEMLDYWRKKVLI